MHPSREESLFALALTTPAAGRAAWLDRECGDDIALRQRLEALLAELEQSDARRSTQAEAEGLTIKLDPADMPDDAVGQTLVRYKLLGIVTVPPTVIVLLAAFTHLRGLQEDRGFLFRAEALEIAHLHDHARILRERDLVAEEEFPIQRGEGTGARAHALAGIEAATGAVVRHALDVFAARNVGLRGHHAAVGVLRHAKGVRQFDPFDRIDIDSQIPRVNFARTDAEEQRKEATDHQALDVVGVAEVERLAERVAQAESDGGRVFDLASRKTILRFHNDRFMSLAFSHNGRILAAGTARHLIHLWDLQSGRQVGTLRGHVAGVAGLSFSADGKTLASCGDTRVKLWNIETLQEILTLSRFSSAPIAALFSSDGSCLATSSYDDRVQLWPAPSFEEIAATEAKEKTEIRQP